MNLAAIFLLVVLLANWWRIINARHRRRAAEAQLEIAKCVERLENKMLLGEITIGDVCHDRMFKRMIEIQSATLLGVRWNWWKKSTKDEAAMQELVKKEVLSKTELGGILASYSLAVTRVFHNQRPFMAVAFYFWMLVTGCSFAALLGGACAAVLALLSLVRLANIVAKSCGGVFSDAIEAWKVYEIQVQQGLIWTFLRWN